MKRNTMLGVAALGAVALFLASSSRKHEINKIVSYYDIVRGTTITLPEEKQVPLIVDSEIGFPHFADEPRPSYPSNDRADNINCWDSTTRSYQFRSVAIQHWLNG